MAIKTISYNFKSYDLSYELINNNHEKTILVLHGWGANKEIMKKAFGKLLPEFCHIYLDLPGFGGSNIKGVLSSVDYANITNKFLKEISKKPEIIMGHSFGGKIATLLNPKCLVLLSSAGIIPRKPFSVQIKIFIFKIMKLFGGGKLFSLFASNDVKGMSRTMYETFKKVVNEDMSGSFKKHKGKALIFWGKGDKATPLRSGEIINSLILNSSFFPLEGDHFFFLLHSRFIANIIGEENVA